MNHWCTNLPQACCKKRKVGREGKGQKQAVKVFPLKAFKKESFKKVRAHPEGLCDKYESAETMLLLSPSPSISLLFLIPYLLALLKKKAKQESGQIMSKLLILAWRKHAYRIETGKYLTSSHKMSFVKRIKALCT